MKSEVQCGDAKFTKTFLYYVVLKIFFQGQEERTQLVSYYRTCTGATIIAGL